MGTRIPHIVPVSQCPCVLRPGVPVSLGTLGHHWAQREGGAEKRTIRGTDRHTHRGSYGGSAHLKRVLGSANFSWVQKEFWSKKMLAQNISAILSSLYPF